MATDGPTPPPCAPDVYKKGTLVFVTHTIPSCSMEEWVKQVASRSGQKVDWHFMGGRACIFALGDIEAVKQAICDLIDDHDARYAKGLNELLLEGHHPPRPRWWSQVAGSSS